MRIGFIANIGWRQTPAGDLQAYDGRGNLVLTVIGGVISGKPNKTSNLNVVGGNTTTSTTNVSTGVGAPALTPQISGNVVISATINWQQNTAAAGGQFAIFRNTTGVPASGVSVGTDTLIPQPMNVYPAAVGVLQTAINLTVYDLAATVGTAWTYYIAWVTNNASDALQRGATSIVASEG